MYARVGMVVVSTSVSCLVFTGVFDCDPRSPVLRVPWYRFLLLLFLSGRCLLQGVVLVRVEDCLPPLAATTTRF